MFDHLDPKHVPTVENIVDEGYYDEEADIEDEIKEEEAKERALDRIQILRKQK
jgi:hypothetical protein